LSASEKASSSLPPTLSSLLITSVLATWPCQCVP
jgi:hypothetical protein